MSNPKLSRENVRIGENLRQAILRARAKSPNLTNKHIAQVAGIHPVHLSRIIGGYGASVATIERIAGVIGANAANIISKGKRKPLYTVRTIEEVLSSNAVLNQFVGGADRVALEWSRKWLFNIFQQCRKRREATY